jgi:hypothetical protein
MKSLWQKVVPMVRCWKILVPLKLEDGYEAACLALEGAVWCLVSIELLISQQAPDDTEADPDVSRMNLRIDVDRCAVRGSDAQFEPP